MSVRNLHRKDYNIDMKIFLVFYAIMTAITFVLYGVDKSKAKKRQMEDP